MNGFTHMREYRSRFPSDTTPSNLLLAFLSTLCGNKLERLRPRVCFFGVLCHIVWQVLQAFLVGRPNLGEREQRSGTRLGLDLVTFLLCLLDEVLDVVFRIYNGCCVSNEPRPVIRRCSQ